MTQALKKLKLFVFIILLIEILGVGGLVSCYFFQWPDILLPYLTIEFWMLLSGGIIILDIFFFWIAYLNLFKVRQKSDLKAAQLIGHDVSEAYSFAQLGLVVVDKKGTILWDSEIFKERNIEILDNNIYDLYPALKDLIGSTKDATVTIEISSRQYEVKYLEKAQLFIFKDCTEYETIFKYSRDHAIVIGMIVLDNYNDLIGGSDDNNEIFNKAKQEVLDYAKEFNLLLKKYRNDSYLIICNRVSLENMEKDNFSILKKVKAAGRINGATPTISLGFSYNFPDVNKLNEMASNAIDIALSRGGDQAVVSKYGDEVRFYGGNTNAVESVSRVKARSIADSVIALIEDSNDVYIMGHQMMDMDALGSCLGVKTICDRLHKPCRIIYDPKQTEKKTKGAIETVFDKAEIDSIFISPKEATDQAKSTSLIVVCDTSNPLMVMAPRIVERSTKIVIFDHHRRGENYIDRPILSYIDPSAASACELVTGLIKYASINPGIGIEPRIATIMLSGIFLDTNYFKSKITGSKSFDASEELKKNGADNAQADEFLKDEFEEVTLINSITSKMQTPAYGVVYCVASENDLVDRTTLAKAANSLLQLKGVQACFVLGRTGQNEVRISARSDGSVNVQLLTEKLGGGGRFTSAAALFEDKSVQYVENELVNVIEKYLNDAKVDKQEEAN